MAIRTIMGRPSTMLPHRRRLSARPFPDGLGSCGAGRDHVPVPDLPSGTVTLLFTDIEGSTRLLEELGDDYAEVLAEHHRVLREVFSRHNGVEVDTAGDGFFVAFARATDAVAAAADGQSALDSGPVRVRIGIHTGEPTLTETKYVGIDVHKAARIMSAGHGGQVLVSEATRQLLDSADTLDDLGQHRLKDLGAPERLYQLGGKEFPPLKTLHRTNLPIQATPLVGRERELDEAGALLRANRLVTLTGSGGTGRRGLRSSSRPRLRRHFPTGRSGCRYRRSETRRSSSGQSLWPSARTRA